jgi:transcriptional regulator with XRE-family HTH domain
MVNRVAEPKKDQISNWGYDIAVLSGRLRQLRAASRKSAIDVSKEIRLSESQFSKIENGIRGVSTATLIRLAKYYGVTTDYLLGLSDDDGGKLV